MPVPSALLPSNIRPEAICHNFHTPMHHNPYTVTSTGLWA
jgi:hypothetical protein